MEQLNQQQPGAEVAQSGEPAVATAQASSETTGTASSGADATLADVGLTGASPESTSASPTGSAEGSTTGDETGNADSGASAATVTSTLNAEGSANAGGEVDDAPHPVRTYADILRGKFQRAEAVALSDIERLFDLIEEHL